MQQTQLRAKFNFCHFHLNKFIQDFLTLKAKPEFQEWQMWAKTSSFVDLILLHRALPLDLCQTFHSSMLSPMLLLGALAYHDFLANRYVIFYFF